MFRKSLLGLLLFLMVAAGAGTYWYQSIYLPPRYSPAAPEALAALQSTAEVNVTTDDWIVMQPAGRAATLGVIFYPGGQVAPEGYAEPLRSLAAAGYLVVLVPMPLDLAVIAPDRAEGVMGGFPDIKRWVIAGHSLGAAMACRFVSQHPDAVNGLLLWDGYPPDTDDLTRITIPVRQIYRSGADGTAPEAYRKTDHLMPAQTERITIAGASHMGYGRFIPAQRFEKMPADITQASIPIEEQHARVVEASLEFLGRIAEGDAGTLPQSH